MAPHFARMKNYSRLKQAYDQKVKGDAVATAKELEELSLEVETYRTKIRGFSSLTLEEKNQLHLALTAMIRESKRKIASLNRKPTATASAVASSAASVTTTPKIETKRKVPSVPSRNITQVTTSKNTAQKTQRAQSSSWFSSVLGGGFFGVLLTFLAMGYRKNKRYAQKFLSYPSPVLLIKNNQVINYNGLSEELLQGMLYPGEKLSVQKANQVIRHCESNKVWSARAGSHLLNFNGQFFKRKKLELKKGMQALYLLPYEIDADISDVDVKRDAGTAQIANERASSTSFFSVSDLFSQIAQELYPHFLFGLSPAGHTWADADPKKIEMLIEVQLLRLKHTYGKNALLMAAGTRASNDEKGLCVSYEHICVESELAGFDAASFVLQTSQELSRMYGEKVILTADTRNSDEQGFVLLSTEMIVGVRRAVDINDKKVFNRELNV